MPTLKKVGLISGTKTYINARCNNSFHQDCRLLNITYNVQCASELRNQRKTRKAEPRQRLAAVSPTHPTFPSCSPSQYLYLLSNLLPRLFREKSDSDIEQTEPGSRNPFLVYDNTENSVHLSASFFFLFKKTIILPQYRLRVIAGSPKTALT